MVVACGQISYVTEEGMGETKALIALYDSTLNNKWMKYYDYVP